jgi:hypothetical protein
VNKSTPNRQLEFQQRVLTAYGHDYRLFLEHAKIWWRNPTNANSLRMTRYGLDFFTKKLDLKTYKIAVDKPLNFKHLIQLERLFTAPYFLHAGAITVFSEQDAIMLQLHAGNLDQYLDNLEINQ